jgi:hypothetical protein
MGNDYLGDESIARIVKRGADLGMDINEGTYELFSRYRPYTQTVKAIRTIIDETVEVKEPGCN